MTEKMSSEIFGDPDNRSSGGTFEPEGGHNDRNSTFEPEGDHNDGNSTNNNLKQTMDMECEKAEYKSEVCELPTGKTPEINKGLACLVCRKRCDSTLSLKKHVCKHICNVPIYQCKECKGHFADKVELLMHSDEKYEDGKGYLYKNSYVCSLCGRKFNKKSVCRDHIVQHKNMTHECKKCGWMFDTSYRVHVHRSLWHLRQEDEESPKTSVIKTVPDVNGDKNLGYKCWMQNCTEFFVDFEILTEHMKLRHRATHQTCKLCTRFINSRTEFDRHVRQHESLKYKCLEEYCGALYEDFKMLRSHYNSRHKFGISESDEHRYVDKMGSTSDQVSPEIFPELSVNPVSGHVCNICSRLLPTEDQLQYHVQNHDKMIYVCKVSGCGWAFQMYQKLGGHVSRVHTSKGGNAGSPARGESSFQKRFPECDLCGRKFKFLPDFEYHIQHHDSLKYVCREAGCIRRYDKFYSLQLHCKKDHRVSISIKDEVFYIREYLSDDAGIANNFSAIAEVTGAILGTSPSHALGGEMFACKELGCVYVRERFATLQAHYYSNHKTKISIKDKGMYLLGATAIKVEEDSSVNEKSSELSTTENNLLNGPAVQNSVNGGPEELLQSFVNPPETLNGKEGPLEASRPFTCTGRKCNICNRYFINDAELEYHQDNHYRMQHTCRFANCGFMYEELDQLQCHYQVRHTKQTGKSAGQTSESNTAPHVCNLCTRRFRSEQFLEHHLKHHDKMKYMCQEGCKHLFEDFTTLYRHYHKVHNQKVTKVNEHLYEIDGNSAGPPVPGRKINILKNVCSLCSRRFQTEKALQRHIEHHDEMIYMCRDGCGAMYEVYNKLYIHYQNVHKKSISKMDLPLYLIHGKEIPECDRLERLQSIQCDLCGRPFRLLANYENHLQNHDRMKYTCDRGCGYLYEQMYQLRNHYYTVHKCGISTTDEAKFLIENAKVLAPGVDAPMLDESEGATSLDRTCKICNRHFNRVEKLTHHVENHEKMKYKCDQGCGFMYQKFELMRWHYNHKHKMSISLKDKHRFLVDGVLMDANTSQETLNTDDSQKTVHYEDLNSSAELSDKKLSRMEKTCGLCKRYFVNYRNLEDHLKNHDNMKYRCIHGCSFLYEEFSPLKYHCRDTHKIVITVKDIPTYTIPPQGATSDEPTSCSLCKRQFHKPKKCVRHMKKHHKMTFKCEYCKWLYEEFKSLQLHYKRRHKEDISPAEETKYRIENDRQNLSTTVKLSVKSCTLCYRKFHIEEKCAEHMRNHAKMVFKCQECGWMYEDFEALRGHYQRRHDLSIAVTDEQQYKIDPSEIEAETDKKEFDGEQKMDGCIPQFPCRECGRQFRSEKRLSHHLEIHHLMIYSCDLCGWQYETFDVFHTHYRRIHDIVISRFDEHKYRMVIKEARIHKADAYTKPKNEPKVKCSTCGREFQGQQEEYQYHIKNHDLLWCKCAVCGWTFEEVDALQRHSFTHYTSKSGRNPHKSTNLEQVSHANGVELTTGTENCTPASENKLESAKTTGQTKLAKSEMNFECQDCGRTFRSEFRLNSHIENHERMTYLCKVCGWRFETFNTLQVHHAVHHKSRINSTEEQIYTTKPAENSPRPDKSPRQGQLDHEKVIPKSEKQGGKVETTIASPGPLKLTEAECLEQIGRVKSKFQCLICGRKYELKAKAITHIQNHQHVMYTCESCGWMFESQAALKIHNYHRHNENKKEAKQTKSANIDNSRSLIQVQATIKKEPEEDMCTKYKCFRCRMLFDEFCSLQEHYMSEHNTMINSDAQSMCMVKAPALAQPETPKPANIFESLASNPVIGEQGDEECSTSNEKKRKRMSEEEVVGKIKKKRRTTTGELSDADSGTETVINESPTKTKLSSPVIKLFPVDGKISSPGKKSPARSMDNTRKSPDTLSSLLNGTD